MATRFRPFVGLRRLHAGRSASLKEATLSAREQFKAIRDNFDRLVSGLRDITPDAVEYALQPILDRSQELVPVKTGELKNSGYLEVRRMGDNTLAEIGYGKGGYPYYAPYVHEDLTAHHEPPTSAKFLEIAANEQMDQIVPRVVEFLSGINVPDMGEDGGEQS